MNADMCDCHIRIIFDSIYCLNDLIQFCCIVAVCFVYDHIVYREVDECTPFLGSGFQRFHLRSEKYELRNRYRLRVQTGDTGESFFTGDAAAATFLYQ